MGKLLEKRFRLTEHGTDVRTEIGAGLTTFFAMAYIIFVNPQILAAAGMDADAVMIATCLGAAVGSIICAFLSNQPYAMAPGMGLNTFFAFTLCGAAGYSWQQALSLTFAAGLIFLAVSVLPLRDMIIRAVPESLRHGICAGIGLFIALIGLLNAGLVVMDGGFPALGNLGSKECLTALFGLVVTILLLVRGVRGGIFIGMMLTMLACLLTGQTSLPGSVVQLPGALGGVFLKLDFTVLAPWREGLQTTLSLIALLFSMSMVDMFDTLGFLIGASSTADSKGETPVDGRVLIADAAGTVIGALIGTSTVTTYAESATGVSAGGRTGLTALTTALCFAAAVFFAPLTGVVTSAVTSPALIIVGLYMFIDLKKVNFDCLDDVIPVFLTVLSMPLAYSITAGIGIGFISYVLCKLAAGKRKEIHPACAVLSLVFLVYFCI